MLRKYVMPKNTISLDMDWFYRMFGRAFLWTVVNPLQWFDNALVDSTNQSESIVLW